MPNRVSYVGRTFGRLKVIKDGPIALIGTRPTKASTSICLCDCGKEITVLNNSLRIGNTKSCGCLNDEVRRATFTTHGKSRTKEYAVWEAMIQRCTNPNHKQFEDWGGRGIKICDRWRHSFANFFADMGECPPGLEIDRYPNNDGNYEPGNCRWATRKQANRNTRRNLVYTVNGVTACLKDLCETFGKSYEVVKSRVRVYGWEFERAWSEPVHPEFRISKGRGGRPKKQPQSESFSNATDPA